MRALSVKYREQQFRRRDARAVRLVLCVADKKTCRPRLSNRAVGGTNCVVRNIKQLAINKQVRYR